MSLAKFKADVSHVAANHRQMLLSAFATLAFAALASIAVNTALIVGAVSNIASPRYLPGLAQFKGNGLVAVSVLSAVTLPGLSSAPISLSNQAAPSAVTQAVSAPLSEPVVPASSLPSTVSGGAFAQGGAPLPPTSAALLASAEVDEYATPSMFLIRQLRIIAGEQLVELRVSVLLSSSGEVESLEIVSSKGDIKVIASWISVLRSARFYPPTKQLQGVASKLVFEFSTY